MDLEFIQEQLDNFSTFGGAIGGALQGIPDLLGNVADFFENFDEISETTSNLSSELTEGEADNGESTDGDNESFSHNLSGDSSEQDADAQ